MTLRRGDRATPLLAAALTLAGAAIFLLAAPPARAAEPAAEGPPRTLRCDRDTVITLAGLDTLGGTLLLRTADGWLLEASPSPTDPGGGDWTETVPYHPEPTGARVYGVSVGAGPLFGVRRCGDGCLQAVRWEAGSWTPLGEPLRDAPSGTAHTTWDLGGTPWLVLQSPLAAGDGPRDGVRAAAWRLVEGRWHPAGTAVVRSAGAAAAVPDPQNPDAVLSGTVRFAAGGEPETWLPALPELAAEDVGVLVPVEGGAAVLTAAGRLLYSRDGERWLRSRWTPWPAHPTRLHVPGRDYSVDLATGDRRGPLHTVWIDRRDDAEGRLHLARWSPGGGWTAVAEMEPAVTTLDGARLGYSEIAVAAPGTWVLLAGCVNTANGPGLVLRTHGPEGLTRPRFLPLVPAAPPQGPAAGAER